MAQAVFHPPFANVREGWGTPSWKMQAEPRVFSRLGHPTDLLPVLRVEELFLRSQLKFPAEDFIGAEEIQLNRALPGPGSPWGLTLRRTARSNNRSKGVCGFIPSAYSLPPHPPGYCCSPN